MSKNEKYLRSNNSYKFDIILEFKLLVEVHFSSTSYNLSSTSDPETRTLEVCFDYSNFELIDLLLKKIKYLIVIFV